MAQRITLEFSQVAVIKPELQIVVVIQTTEKQKTKFSAHRLYPIQQPTKTKKAPKWKLL